MSVNNEIANMEVLDDDQALAFTQKARRKIVSKILEKGEIPEDKGEQIMLLQALDGMDRAALGNKRIKADEKASDALGDSSALIAQMLTQMAGNVKLAKSEDIVDVEAKDITAPALPDTIPDPILVPGETTIGAPQLDYDSFMNSMNGREIPQLTDDDQ